MGLAEICFPDDVNRITRTHAVRAKAASAASARPLPGETYHRSRCWPDQSIEAQGQRAGFEPNASSMPFDIIYPGATSRLNFWEFALGIPLDHAHSPYCLDPRHRCVDVVVRYDFERCWSC